MKCILVLSSVTYAMKAVRILSQQGIYSSVVKTPEVIKVRGCGYGVLSNADCEKVKPLLTEAGISVIAAINDNKR